VEKMFRQYIKPLTGTTLGGVIGWMIARGVAPNHTGGVAYYLPFTVLVTAFAAVGGILTSSPRDLVIETETSNIALLEHLKTVFAQEPVALLSHQEIKEYQKLTKNRSADEIARINFNIEKYKAAKKAWCPNIITPTRISQLISPITLLDKRGIFPPVTYDYERLYQRIEQNLELECIDSDSGLVLNLQNFYFDKDYVPEIMDFIYEVRKELSKRPGPLPLLPHGVETRLIFYQINPDTSRYQTPITTDEIKTFRL
jgi:hypothetical protein